MELVSSQVKVPIIQSKWPLLLKANKSTPGSDRMKSILNSCLNSTAGIPALGPSYPSL